MLLGALIRFGTFPRKNRGGRRLSTGKGCLTLSERVAQINRLAQG
jgi:hypothetical protein